VLLPFKKAMYTAPSDRSQGPAPKRPRAEAVPSETGIFLPAFLSHVIGIMCPKSRDPIGWFSAISGGARIRTGKYSARSIAALAHLGNLPAGSDAGLISAAYSESSWKRTCAALNSFKRFAKDSGSIIVWPFSETAINNFVSWALKTAKLSPNTVNVYLSDLVTCHKLRGLDPSACSNFLAKTMIKGAKNLASYSATTKEPKAVMTLSCLKILGHEIAKTDWSALKKSIYWAACTVAFFGSFRMGELLCPSENSYSSDTLIWSDVIFNGSNSVILNIRHPKSNRAGGEKVEVFNFSGHNCCPVKALRCLNNNRVIKSQLAPVFALATNEYLCKKTFNSTLKELLRYHLPGHTLLGHSFRAGIPSALSAVPELVTTEEIQAWGRWSSQSYLAYTKHRHLSRQKIFEKFVSVSMH
jgi:hypothetical protein